jgi:hypothetical protein
MALVAVGWVRGRWTGLARIQHAAFAVATALLVAQLAVWGLIGWGFA